MRKIYVSLLASLFATASLAQVKVTSEFELGYPDRNALSIPKEFTYNGAPLLTMYDDTEDRNLLVYDENIDLIKTINIRREKTFDYQLTYQDEEREVASVNVSEEREECLWMTFKNWLYQQMAVDPGFTESQLAITKEANGDSLIIRDLTTPYTLPEQLYFGYEYFGKQYPKFYWRCKNGQMYQYYIVYKVAYTDWHVTGTRTENRQETLRRLQLCNINLNYGDGRANYYFEASQTLFNEDEEFEYVIPKYVLAASGNSGPNSDVVVDNPYGEDETVELHRSTILTEKSQLVLAGFQVVSADGNIIKDLDFGDGFEARPYYAYVITIGTKTYMALNGYENGKNSTIFYLVDREATDIKKVNIAPAHLLVSPTIVEKNAMINVNLDDNATSSDIIVVSSSGAQVKKVNVPAGQKEAQLALSGAAGVYHVARIQNNRVSASQKIILK